MYVNHNVFAQPVGTTRIWRYMDFTKLIALLETGSLFFSRTDLLGDKFEGSFSQYSLMNPSFPGTVTLANGTSTEEMRKAERRAQFLYTRYTSYVSCWHMGDHESAAMWEYYASHGGGVAVQSTLDRLKGCLWALEPKDVPIRIGRVSYVDYDTIPIPEGNIYYPLLHKRRSFEHEKELRAVLSWRSDAFDQKIPGPLVWLGPIEQLDEIFYKTTQPPGIPVRIDIAGLIDRIYVAPQSPSWIGELIRRMPARYGLPDIEVHQSSLDDDPLY